MKQVRCPNCNKLACEAEGRVRVKCVRCGTMYEQEVGATRTPDAV